MRALTMIFAPAALMTCDLATAASFPCDQARTQVEQAICTNATLSEYDELLARYYRAARAALGAAGSCLRKDQRDWLAARRNPCKDTECLGRVYLERLAELDPLSPGIPAARHIDLPRVKALMWVLPPAEDTVAAPPPGKPELLVAPGKIIDDIAAGDGIVLQTPDGSKHALLLSMFMNKSGAVALESLMHDQSAMYEARGTRTSSADGSSHFSPGACRFIYRLP